MRQPNPGKGSAAVDSAQAPMRRTCGRSSPEARGSGRGGLGGGSGPGARGSGHGELSGGRGDGLDGLFFVFYSINRGCRSTTSKKFPFTVTITLWRLGLTAFVNGF